MSDPTPAAEALVCPICGPAKIEQHPRHPAAARCSNCKHWLRACRDCARTLTPFQVWQAVEGDKLVLPLCRNCFDKRVTTPETAQADA